MVPGIHSVTRSQTREVLEQQGVGSKKSLKPFPVIAIIASMYFIKKILLKKVKNNRITRDVWVVNVVAIQKGTKYPNRFVIMSGDIDSRVFRP